MENEQTLDIRGRYQWVWQVTNVDVKPDESVPMEEGDRLYIYFVTGDQVCFHHRSRNGNENAGLWESGVGVYSEETGLVVGQLPDATTFSMSLKFDANGAGTLSCDHRRNPPTGGWQAQD